MGVYPVVRNLYTTPASSDVTSETYFIGDANNSTVNLQVAGDGSSSMTVQVSNSDGLRAAIPENSWSNHSVVANPNATKYISDVPEGMRWLRCLRSESAMTAILSFQANGGR